MHVGIFAVRLSDDASYAYMLHAIEDVQGITDVLVGARRVYIRSFDFAETFSYDPRRISASDFGNCTTPPQKRFVAKCCIPSLEPKMDDTSGRIAMAASPSTFAVFYYSQYDKDK
ncbi:hypothetical protein HWV62_12863 [Athelia sp. TMB]|nr:hypothetical protein HWV62_12863 [Athelia sp. TMB]